MVIYFFFFGFHSRWESFAQPAQFGFPGSSHIAFFDGGKL